MQTLIQLYDEAIIYLLELGFSRQTIVYRRENIDSATPQEIQDGIKWLDSFLSVRVHEYRETLKIHTQERWAILNAFGDNGLYEQERLKAAIEAIKTDWLNRPAILLKFKAHKKDSYAKRQPEQQAPVSPNPSSKSDKRSAKAKRRLAGGLDILPRSKANS